ncbi:MAG TPA: thymidine phosphorylase [Pyrinomonadaceae bacterium]|nr:thymidine phosphorylase [Pyrinomonadaceae bacterium]
MRPQEIIRKKRDGAALSREEIASFVGGVADGGWADYQISALVMAMFLRGLDGDEAAFLTNEMLHSGEVLDFSDIDAPKADKHSTGGVGDKTSLIIAPLAAACGVAVPMISGRGLGHTGGTLDKLESIKGYNVNLSLKEFKKVIKTCGFAMTGQTAEIAPADKKLYALRDATATVEYIPLIVASIMSKKMAEGLDALVLDVKTGSGAFMQEFAKSKELAEAMCATGTKCGVRTEAVISDMNQPLGKFVGNALEVYECIKILRGEIEKGFEETWELSLELTARMLVLTAVETDLKSARAKCLMKLQDGSALEKFRENIELQHGFPGICDKPESLLEKDLIQFEIKSPRAGFVSEIDAKAIGEAVTSIGGGRIKTDDTVDFQVGFSCEAKIGNEIKQGETIGILFCRDENQAVSVEEKLQKSYWISDEKPEVLELIKSVVGSGN